MKTSWRARLSALFSSAVVSIGAAAPAAAPHVPRLVRIAGSSHSGAVAAGGAAAGAGAIALKVASTGGKAAVGGAALRGGASMTDDVFRAGSAVGGSGDDFLRAGSRGATLEGTGAGALDDGFRGASHTDDGFRGASHTDGGFNPSPFADDGATGSKFRRFDETASDRHQRNLQDYMRRRAAEREAAGVRVHGRATRVADDSTGVGDVVREGAETSVDVGTELIDAGEDEDEDEDAQDEADEDESFAD